MTIVRSTYRYKRPPRKRKMAPLAGPAVVTPKRLPTERKKLEPASAVDAQGEARQRQPSRRCAAKQAAGVEQRPDMMTRARNKSLRSEALWQMSQLNAKTMADDQSKQRRMRDTNRVS